jgi:hypothetical protein
MFLRPSTTPSALAGPGAVLLTVRDGKFRRLSA